MNVGPVPTITLNFAQKMFEMLPNNKTAGVYLRVLMEYQGDDMITDDTFLNGLASIAVYLNPKLVRDSVMPYTFEGKNREDSGFYTDYEFSDGDPCRLLRLTRDHEAGKWYGVILTSDTPDGAFEHDNPMPEDVLTALITIARHY